MTSFKKIRRELIAWHRRLREWWLVGKGLLSKRHPVLAHLIPIRRCNLSCAYCNEYDDHSKPVPTEVMLRRIDWLASLGTMAITLSGGEPLLHPDLDDLIRRIRRHGAIAGLITNGYLLTRERIERLNRAGLEHLQISIDNVYPDEISKKSLKVLDKKLELLAEYADFHVNINSVLGSGVRNAGDALTIAHRAIELGLSSTVGVIHDSNGQVRPLSEEEQMIFRAIRSLGKGSYARLNKFQSNIAQGKANDWRCRAGSRYLYICEDGLVHYCSQQRGYPAIPIEQYTPELRRREYHTRKSCAPYCTISCVQQVAMLDNRRDPQVDLPPLRQPVSVQPSPLVQLQAPSTSSDD